MGNPSLSDIRVMLIGVRNNAPVIKDGTVWINELKVTEFNNSGGWAAKGNINLGVSDIATLNMEHTRYRTLHHQKLRNLRAQIRYQKQEPNAMGPCQLLIQFLIQ